MLEAVIRVTLPSDITDRHRALDWVSENIPLSGDFSVNIEEPCRDCGRMPGEHSATCIKRDTGWKR